MPAKPDKELLRTLNDADVGALTGHSASEVRRALRNLRDIGAADTDPETRAAILTAVTERPGESDIGEELVARVLEAAPRLDRVTDLLNIRGIGPQRFLGVVDSLASANVRYLLDQEDRWEAALALRSSLDRDRARELFDLVAAGRADEFLGADFPLLADITDVVCNPDRVNDPGFDADAFAARMGFVGALLPTPAFIALLGDDADDAETPPPDIPAPGVDPPPREVLDESWPRPEEANRDDCPNIKLVFDPVVVEPPQLGDVRGLREVLAELTDIQITAARLALTSFAFADRVNQFNPFGVKFPDSLRMRLMVALGALRIVQGDTPDPGADAPGPLEDLVRLADRMLQSIVRILQAEILFTIPTRSARIVRANTTLLVTGPPGADLNFSFVSRMLSSYRYGVGQGTQFPASGDDLPWFAKIDIRPFRSGPVQLGAGGSGATGRQSGAGGAFLSLNADGRLSLPVALNGNYGLARVIAQLDNTPCTYASPLFRVLGAFQEDIAAEAALRYDNTEEGIRKIEVAADAITELVDITKDALGVLVGLGDAAATLIAIVKALLRLTLQTTLEIARTQNRRQRTANLEIADAYPRRLVR